MTPRIGRPRTPVPRAVRPSTRTGSRSKHPASVAEVPKSNYNKRPKRIADLVGRYMSVPGKTFNGLLRDVPEAAFYGIKTSDAYRWKKNFLANRPSRKPYPDEKMRKVLERLSIRLRERERRCGQAPRAVVSDCNERGALATILRRENYAVEYDLCHG